MMILTFRDGFLRALLILLPILLLFSITDCIAARTLRSKFNFDQQGNIVSRTDANGNVINYSYDKLNRIVGIQYPDYTSVEFVYNHIGQLAQRAPA